MSGNTKEERVAAWIEQVKRHENVAFFVFEVGSLPQTVQSWLATSGYQVPVISGGYKALRSYLLKMLEECLSELDLIVIGGRTGVAKTALLNQAYDTLRLPVVDLEGVAHHRVALLGNALNRNQLRSTLRIALPLNS